MKNAFRMLALSAASTLALAGAALADPPRQATVGQTISGALTPAAATTPSMRTTRSRCRPGRASRP